MLAATFLLALACNAVAGSSQVVERNVPTRVERAQPGVGAQPAITVAHLAADQSAFSAQKSESSSKQAKTSKTKSSKAEPTSSKKESSSKTSAEQSSSTKAEQPSSTTEQSTSNEEQTSSKISKPSSSKPPKTSSPSPSSSTASAGDQIGTSIVYVTSPGPPTQTGIANGARIFFPRSTDYWVLKEVDAIQWEPPLQQPATIHLTNGDDSLLPHAQELAVKVPVGFKQMAFSVTEPAKPGKGYILVMKDSGNGTSEYKESTADGQVLSESEPFEIKAHGASPVIPAPFTAETVQAIADSGGLRVEASTAGWSVAIAIAVAGAVCGVFLA